MISDAEAGPLADNVNVVVPHGDDDDDADLVRAVEEVEIGELARPAERSAIAAPTEATIGNASDQSGGSVAPPPPRPTTGLDCAENLVRQETAGVGENSSAVGNQLTLARPTNGPSAATSEEGNVNVENVQADSSTPGCEPVQDDLTPPSDREDAPANQVEPEMGSGDEAGDGGEGHLMDNDGKY